MRWKRILQKLTPSQLVDIFIELVLEILNAWALIRTVLLLALVLTVVISGLISDTDKEQFKGFLDEKISMVNWMHSPNK